MASPDERTRERCEVAKIESEMVRRDKRPRLLDVCSHHFPQSRMQQMGRRVVSGRLGPARGVHLSRHPLAALKSTGTDTHFVQPHPRHRDLAVEDLRAPLRPHEPPDVTHLPAGFGVERSCIQQDHPRLSLT